MERFDDVEMNFGLANDFFPTNQDFETFFYDVHDVAQPATKTRDVDNVQEATPPSSTQMASSLIDIEATSRSPPRNVDVLTSTPLVSDPPVTHTSQPPLKR